MRSLFNKPCGARYPFEDARQHETWLHMALSLLTQMTL